MSEIDSVFIDKLKSKIPSNISFIEEVASSLAISYDAAYRRLNGKVSFSLNESVLLSKKYDISLNKLFEVGNTNSYLVNATKTITRKSDYLVYFNSLLNELTPLVGKRDAFIVFSARELPMFYFFEQPILIRFKIFIWLNVLKTTTVHERITFNNYIVSEKLTELAQETRVTYDAINVTEMWSFGALNNVLQQLLYLFHMRQIDIENAINICQALVSELKKVEYKTRFAKDEKNCRFTLYSNEFLMMNNSLILKNKNKLRFGYPYALLKFFMIDNQKACKDQEFYIRNQMQHATCISNTSTKEHTAFFNAKYDKIKQVIAVMKNEEHKPLFL